MMRAVWSFWTKPFLYDRRFAWLSEKHHLLAWILSFETAREHYPDTCLVTDTLGVQMLVDGLGLPFESVSTELDSMHTLHPDWWALGKLYAYRAQQKPFVHIDSDVFLWKRLPEALEKADVFAQSPEYFSLDGGSWYRPRECAYALMNTGGWVPEAWQWFVQKEGNQAACCGIIGGNHLAFIQDYAEVGIRCVTAPENQPSWLSLGVNMADNLVVEQYSLVACLEYHNHAFRTHQKNQPVSMAYLFNSPEEAFNEECARRAGYTHLIGEAKRNPELVERIEQRVKRDYPDRYEACLSYLAHASYDLAA